MVGAGINERGSCSYWGPVVAWAWTQALTEASPVLLKIKLPRFPIYLFMHSTKSWATLQMQAQTWPISQPPIPYPDILLIWLPSHFVTLSSSHLVPHLHDNLCLSLCSEEETFVLDKFNGNEKLWMNYQNTKGSYMMPGRTGQTFIGQWQTSHTGRRNYHIFSIHFTSDLPRLDPHMYVARFMYHLVQSSMIWCYSSPLHFQ